jgi:hypothetical protein
MEISGFLLHAFCIAGFTYDYNIIANHPLYIYGLIITGMIISTLIVLIHIFTRYVSIIISAFDIVELMKNQKTPEKGKLSNYYFPYLNNSFIILFIIISTSQFVGIAIISTSRKQITMNVVTFFLGIGVVSLFAICVIVTLLLVLLVVLALCFFAYAIRLQRRTIGANNLYGERINRTRIDQLKFKNMEASV